MNKLSKLEKIGITIIIILIIVIIIGLGISFLYYKNIKYQEPNKETVVKEEIESKVKDKPTEKEPIKSLEQEEYEEYEEEDSIMIF